MLGVTLGNYRAGDETLKYLSSEVGTRGSLEVKCGQEEPGTPPLELGAARGFPRLERKHGKKGVQFQKEELTFA